MSEDSAFLTRAADADLEDGEPRNALSGVFRGLTLQGFQGLRRGALVTLCVSINEDRCWEKGMFSLILCAQPKSRKFLTRNPKPETRNPKQVFERDQDVLCPTATGVCLEPQIIPKPSAAQA